MTRHLHIDLRPNLNNQLVEAEWVQKEVGRHSPLSRFAPSLKKSRPIGFDRGRVVKAFCLAVAVFCIVYFPAAAAGGVPVSARTTIS
jgi:hypothetical protein